jgi:hypothetical protein
VYAIEPVTEEMIENFLSFGDDYISGVLEDFREDGFVTLYSIDVKDLKKAVEEDNISGKILHQIGKANCGDWDALIKLTSKEEVNFWKKYEGPNPDWVVRLYCQGKLINVIFSGRSNRLKN